MIRAKLIPDVVKEGKVISLAKDDSVITAVRLMAQHNIGSILVLEQGKLAGIFTERDVINRIVAKGKDPEHTMLGEAMTPNPDTMTADHNAAEALDMMKDRKYRHMPVLDDNGQVIAIVSIRDLYAVVKKRLQEDLDQCEAFVHGQGYS